MTRPDGRRPDELRPLTITPDWLKDPEGSALIRAGETWVICTASVEEKVPPFLKDTGKGWVTAEYAMRARAITIDCDVLQADGGTRTAAITGGFVALALACRRLVAKKLLTASPLLHEVAAVSE